MNEEHESSRRDETLSLLSGEFAEQDTERLLTLVYGELRRAAQQLLGQERGDHTLQATALVHEAYVRLVGGDAVAWKSHRHFFATAARAMRHILVDHARSKNRNKRGGDWNRVTLDLEIPNAGEEATLNVVAVHKALEQLATHSQRQAEIVELRYFAGLEVSAVAKIMDLSERTVTRDWRFARAWLLERLEAE